MALDVFEIFKRLELKAVGLDDKTQKMQEGYFVAFRSIGLPIHGEDYRDPWSPLGVNLEKAIPQPPPSDPKDAPKTGSQSVDTTKAFVANIARSQQAYLSTYALVNDKLQMSNSYSVIPGSSKLADSWYAIITGANGIPPMSELNDEMKRAYEAARANLIDSDGMPTKKFQAYEAREEAYRDAVKARNRAFADAFTDPMKLQAWPVNGVAFHEDVDKAWDRWVGFGFKEEIEQALNTLAAQGTDPAIALIARAKKRFQNSLFEFPGYGLIPWVTLNPRSWYDAESSDGWTEFRSRDLHSENHYSASQTAFGGGGGFNVGLWSGGANFNHSESQANGNSAVQNLEVSFDYCIVDIDRPWLDTSLLNLNNWFLIGDYKKHCISTGLMGQQRPGDGSETTFLPSVVTSFILVKNVRIKWDDWKTQWAQHQESNSAAASFGYFCFTAQASYKHAEQKRDFSHDASGEDIHIPGIQLIGYVSQIMPPSPQGNSSDFQKKRNG